MSGRALLTLAKSERRIQSLRKLIDEPAVTFERDVRSCRHCPKHCASKGRHLGFYTFESSGGATGGIMFERAKAIFVRVRRSASAQTSATLSYAVDSRIPQRSGLPPQHSCRSQMNDPALAVTLYAQIEPIDLVHVGRRGRSRCSFTHQKTAVFACRRITP